MKDVSISVLACLAVSASFFLIAIIYLIVRCLGTSVPAKFDSEAIAVESSPSKKESNRLSRSAKRLSTFLDFRPKEAAVPMPSIREDSLQTINTSKLTPGKMMIATGNFKPTRPDELQVQLGDQITIYQTFSDGWYLSHISNLLRAFGMKWKMNIAGAFPLKVLGDLVESNKMNLHPPEPVYQRISREALITKQPLLMKKRKRSLKLRTAVPNITLVAPNSPASLSNNLSATTRGTTSRVSASSDLASTLPSVLKSITIPSDQTDSEYDTDVEILTATIDGRR
jgi:hypothetical protein